MGDSTRQGPAGNTRGTGKARSTAGSNAGITAPRNQPAAGRRRQRAKSDEPAAPKEGTRPGKQAGKHVGYAKVADEIRRQISSGQLPPSAALPSEAEIRSTYGVSRDTARSAIAVLRGQGLITVIHGKGSFVRRTGHANHTDNRAITHTSTHFTDRASTSGTSRGHRAGDGQGHRRAPGQAERSNGYGESYADADTDRWRPARQHRPSMQHVNATAELALNVDVAEHTPLIVIHRLLEDPAGRRMLHELYLPASTVTHLPSVQQDPYITTSRLYTELSTAGHQLTWSEYVTARMPSPDDAKALHIPDGTPVISTRRITRDATGQTLAVEETQRSAEDTQLAYTITPEPSHVPQT